MITVNEPSNTDKTVIQPRADNAPLNTTILECFMDRMAAIKKVLSPISDTMMTESAAMKACMKPRVFFCSVFGLFISSGSL